MELDEWSGIRGENTLVGLRQLRHSAIAIWRNSFEYNIYHQKINFYHFNFFWSIKTTRPGRVGSGKKLFFVLIK